MEGGRKTEREREKTREGKSGHLSPSCVFLFLSFFSSLLLFVCLFCFSIALCFFYCINFIFDTFSVFDQGTKGHGLKGRG